ncbi:MAG: VOC family protein [Pyrinomonadaceae bacterium MAG19_C2-C3]|nr:VOC family protein [Pyrinomonadaceae bacterium MAG19_C2-C3]
MTEHKARFAGTVDHIAIKTDDMHRDVEAYQRLGLTIETLYEDWAMLRDAKGFGIALLPEGSKHPPHLGLRVESREALEAAAQDENRPLKEHRDNTVSFYTKGTGSQIVELIYYPPNYNPGVYSATTNKAENE